MYHVEKYKGSGIGFTFLDKLLGRNKEFRKVKNDIEEMSYLWYSNLYKKLKKSSWSEYDNFILLSDDVRSKMDMMSFHSNSLYTFNESKYLNDNGRDKLLKYYLDGKNEMFNLLKDHLSEVKSKVREDRFSKLLDKTI